MVLVIMSPLSFLILFESSLFFPHNLAKVLFCVFFQNPALSFTDFFLLSFSLYFIYFCSDLYFLHLLTWASFRGKHLGPHLFIGSLKVRGTQCWCQALYSFGRCWELWVCSRFYASVSGREFMVRLRLSLSYPIWHVFFSPHLSDA